MCVGLVQLFYNFYCAYSGQTLFNSFSLMGYNTLCTGFGVLFFIFDVDVPDKRFCLSNPEFYWSTQYFQNGNFRLFSTFMLRAMFHAAIALFGSVYFLYANCDPTIPLRGVTPFPYCSGVSYWTVQVPRG